MWSDLAAASRLILSDYDLTDLSCQQWIHSVVNGIKNRNKEVISLLDRISPHSTQLNQAISQYNTGNYSAAISRLLTLSYEFPNNPKTEFWLIKSLYAMQQIPLSRAMGRDYLVMFPNDLHSEDIRLLISSNLKEQVQ